jgi:hypothetical protein
MSLTGQERRCIALACAHLAAKHGGVWDIVRELDAENPSIASPEVEVSNGSSNAAIEVKRLTVAELERYGSWKPSLERYLAPDCDGQFLFIPCLGFTLPLGRPVMRQLKKEIARVAPTIRPRGSGAVLVPREGYVVLSRPDLPGQIFCQHSDSDALIAVSPRLNGAYYLVDGGTAWAHTFLTEAGRATWHDLIVAACEKPTSEGRFSWNEEWDLRRFDDGQSSERHFEVLAVSDVFSGDSVVAAVWTMLERGRAKFHRRWAAHHILVFDSAAPIVTPERLEAIAAEFAVEDLGAIESIILVNGDTSTEIWPRTL